MVGHLPSLFKACGSITSGVTKERNLSLHCMLGKHLPAESSSWCHLKNCYFLLLPFLGMDKLSYVGIMTWMRSLQVELRVDGFRVNSMLALWPNWLQGKRKGLLPVPRCSCSGSIPFPLLSGSPVEVGDTQPCSSLQMSLPSESTGIEDPTQPHIVGKAPICPSFCWIPLGQLNVLLGLLPLRHQQALISTPGIQSPDQQAALARHNPSRPVFVEGPFPLWLRNKCVYYHILRADLPPPEEEVSYCQSTCCQSRPPEFDPHDPCGGRRDLTLTNCPLSYTGACINV